MGKAILKSPKKLQKFFPNRNFQVFPAQGANAKKLLIDQYKNNSFGDQRKGPLTLNDN